MPGSHTLRLRWSAQSLLKRLQAGEWVLCRPARFRIVQEARLARDGTHLGVSPRQPVAAQTSGTRNRRRETARVLSLPNHPQNVNIPPLHHDPSYHHPECTPRPGTSYLRIREDALLPPLHFPRPRPSPARRPSATSPSASTPFLESRELPKVYLFALWA